MFFIRTLSIFPLSFLYVLSDYIIYPLARYIMRYRLELVRKNIRTSFPEKSTQEQDAIINAFYHHFADLLVEIAYAYRVSEDEMRKRVTFENIEVLEELSRKTHGSIAYLGHMCNWEWIADVGNQFTDKSMVEYCVYRKLNNPRSDRDMNTIRERRGAICIEKHLLLRKLVELRQASHPFMIGLLADQKPTPNNAHTWTTFLGQETAFLDGGDTLAHKFGYSVLFAHITCPKRGHYHVRLEVITDDPSTMQPSEITLAYARLLEKNIREQPHMWLWSHNRWKWSKTDIENRQKNKTNKQ